VAVVESTHVRLGNVGAGVGTGVGAGVVAVESQSPQVAGHTKDASLLVVQNDGRNWGRAASHEHCSLVLRNGTKNVPVGESKQSPVGD